MKVLKHQRAPWTAPEHLDDSTAQWCRQVDHDFDLDGHHRRLLVMAGEAWDRKQECREILARDGVTIEDRFGQVKPHPLLLAERDAAVLFIRALRELALDIEPPPDSPRAADIRDRQGGPRGA